ncbi:MAG: diacylglycerol kinase family protein [Tractidigestivibacter sp.]|uniref:diacylglycerol/lipid kinase family protein n=1 Tax=Tractidigestivibacter sp. TaxID=2847320 RepID=UPI002A803985|nr:diacylglycerol kinase family protein [Tractidigestivibacter sp.]MDY4534780.1 diacylglycerol kinase family protein [Tractidigestivibacter sp.]
MRSVIIHNPLSGFGSDAIFEFERALVHAGDECTFRALAPDFAPRDVIGDVDDFDVCVLSGGDGSVAGLLYALRNRAVPICVFPSGTANLLFANIGNAPEPAALARACRVGHTATIDLGEISWDDERGNKQVRGFGLMSGTGFDAQLMEAALPNKAAMGQAAYFAAAFANPRPTVEEFTIVVDGQTYRRRGISCMVANNAMIQGDIQIVPDCRMDDGLLDVIVVETQDAAQVLRPLFSGILDREGKSIGRPHLEAFRGREIVVSTERPVPLEIDGDVASPGITEYRARALPAVCNIVVDSMSPYKPSSDAPARFTEADEIAFPKE